mmetsp:Transcript_11559/g.29261  ORF Transcript_11559/g.29261 Transcript_11559/m.29261 type:complete len:213 (-) Transcript_11559:172-810(-)
MLPSREGTRAVNAVAAAPRDRGAAITALPSTVASRILHVASLCCSEMRGLRSALRRPSAIAKASLDAAFISASSAASVAARSTLSGANKRIWPPASRTRVPTASLSTAVMGRPSDQLTTPVSFASNPDAAEEVTGRRSGESDLRSSNPVFSPKRSSSAGNEFENQSENLSATFGLPPALVDCLPPTVRESDCLPPSVRGPGRAVVSALALDW